MNIETGITIAASIVTIVVAIPAIKRLFRRRRAGVPPKDGWHEISDPDGGQRSLFEESRKAYEDIFSEEHLEPWENFLMYIRDTRERLKTNPDKGPLDYYLVFVDTGKVEGMSLVSFYPDASLGFLSYFGIRPSALMQMTGRGKLGIEFIKALPFYKRAHALLFEAEKAMPRDLASNDPVVGGRVRARHLYSLIGAKQVDRVNYLQPLLRPAEWVNPAFHEASNLDLMYWATTNYPSAIPAHLEKIALERLLDFVYLRFYLDGFVQCGYNEQDAARYLTSMRDKVLSSLGGQSFELIDPVGCLNKKEIGGTH